jgi:hypothetical protein
MNINELRGGNLVSYKGYHCEVKFVDTFRRDVYIDLTPYKDFEIFEEELERSSVSHYYYVRVSLSSLNPINIDYELAKKLKIDGREISQYLIDITNHSKVLYTLKIRWDESCVEEANVFILDIDETLVGDNLEFINDYGGSLFEMSHIRYIHQVQNLYFTLTGKEL